MKYTTNLVVLILIVVNACSALVGEETPVVYVDGEPAIAANLYTRAYHNVSADEEGGGPLTSERARGLLDDIIIADVLVREAEAAGYADEEDFVKEMESFSEQTLNLALDEWSGRQVEVTDDEIRTMYEKNLNQRTYSVIYGPRRDRIEEALAKLDAGEAFTDVAAEYSADPSAAETGGKSDAPLPYAGDVYTEALYALEKPGDITGVLTNDFKNVYIILKMEGEVPAEPVEYEDVREDYERNIRFRKAADFLNERLDSYVEEKGLDYNEEVYDALLTTPFTESGGQYSGKDEILVSVDGIDVGFDEVYNILPMYLRSSPEDLDAYEEENNVYFDETLDAAIKLTLRNKIRISYARSIGLDQTPEFKLDYYRKKGDELVSEYYDRVFVPSVFNPTQAELEAYYDENKASFGNPERMKTAYVCAYDEEKIRTWRDAVAAGGDFKTEVYDKWGDYINGIPEEEKESRKPKDSLNLGTYVYKDPERRPTTYSVNSAVLDLLDREVYEYGVGETSPVIAMDDGRYLFFQNVDYTPYSDKPFEDVEGQIRTKLENDVMMKPETDEKLQEWFDKTVAKHKVKVDKGVFKALYKQLSAEEHADE
jgi:hypothetical protein